VNKKIHKVRERTNLFLSPEVISSSELGQASRCFRYSVGAVCTNIVVIWTLP